MVFEIVDKGGNTVASIPRNDLIWIFVSGNQMAIMRVTCGVHQCCVSNGIPFVFRATGVLGRERVFVTQIIDRVAA